MATSHTLYNGEVTLVFDPDAARYRYKVTDVAYGLKDKPARGVTTLLRDVIHKPDLLMWPMNEALGALFDQKFDETTKEYLLGSPKKSLIKPGVAYSEAELAGALNAARKAHTAKGDKGKDVGSMTHKLIELFVADGKEHLDEVYQEFKTDAPVEKEFTPEEYGSKDAAKAAYQIAVGKYAESTEILADNMKIAERAFGGFVKWWNEVKPEVLMVEKPVYSRSMGFAGTFDMVARIKGKTYMIDFKTTNKSQRAPMGIYAEYFIQSAAYSYAFREEYGKSVDDIAIVNVGKDGKVNVVCASDLGISVEDSERTFAFAARLHDWLEATSKLTRDSRIKSILSPAQVEEPES